MVRGLMIVLGMLFSAIGIIGVFLPILPTTPFLLLAAACFVNASPRLFRLLTEHPKFGPAIVRIREGKGIGLKTKMTSTAIATVLIVSFAIWGTSSLHLRIFLGVILAAKIAAMVAIPTYREESSTGEAAEKTASSRKKSSKKKIIKAPPAMTFAIFMVGTLFVLLQVMFAIALGRWVYEAFTAAPSFPWNLIALSAARWVLLLINRWLGSQVSQSVRLNARARLFSAIGRAGADAVRSTGIGRYYELMGERIESLDPMYSLFVPQLFIGILSPILALVIIGYYSTPLALGLLAIMPATPLVLGLLARNFARVGKEYSKASASLGAWYLESIRALPTLGLFSRVKSYQKNLSSASADLRDRTIRLLVVNQSALLLVEIFFSLLILAMATFLGLKQFAIGTISGGIALSIPFLAIELIKPINLVGAFFFAGAAGRQGKKMVTEEIIRLESQFPLAMPQEKPSHFEAAAKESISAMTADKQMLEVKNLCFAYPSNANSPVLNDSNLILPSGQTIGLKGPSGAGKSTLAKLILGFYRPNSGEIFIDGEAASEMTERRRRSLVGYLPQRPYIFGESIRENIALGETGISDAQISQALMDAGLEHLLTQGLDRVLGEDAAMISGGERMRIALARVLARQVRYIVLDEPTAEVDSLTESGLWQALTSTGSGILVIAHRSSTLALCDQVLSMEPIHVEYQKENAL